MPKPRHAARNAAAEPTSEMRRDTRGAILQAARKLLARDGYANLTMRAVANEVGLGVGNLTYHYPSKQRLVRDVIHSAIDEYRDKTNALLVGMTKGNKASFAEFMRWMIEDSASRNTSRLFRELWVMALHDSVVAQAMDRFYEQQHKTIFELLLASDPSLDHATLHAIVRLAGTISEGTNVLFGASTEYPTSIDQFVALSSNVLLDAVASYGRSKPKKLKRKSRAASAG